jgi:hypothetical protein
VGAERLSVHEAPTLALPRSTRGGDKKDLMENMRLPWGEGPTACGSSFSHSINAPSPLPSPFVQGEGKEPIAKNESYTLGLTGQSHVLSFPLAPVLRGEGRGEGPTAQSMFVTPQIAPHPNPLPMSTWGEGIRG